MIKTFKSKETAIIFGGEYSIKLPLLIQRTALRKLLMVYAAQSLNDLRVPPANRLEKLKGGKNDKYSIRVNDQWRVCFEWHHNDAYEVEIIDYH